MYLGLGGFVQNFFVYTEKATYAYGNVLNGFYSVDDDMCLSYVCMKDRVSRLSTSEWACGGF